LIAPFDGEAVVEDRLCLTLKSRLSELETLNRAFQEFAERHSLSASVRSAASLALEEVIVNVITHGYRGRDDQSIAVEVSVTNGELVLVIEDQSPVFDPLVTPPPDISQPLEQRQPGNLGIHLTRKLMDDARYIRAGGRNCLVLTRRLEGRPN
jgi:anti-sigma regulatory factor (Ser/Thr protein kinase)